MQKKKKTPVKKQTQKRKKMRKEKRMKKKKSHTKRQTWKKNTRVQLTRLQYDHLLLQELRQDKGMFDGITA